MKTLTFAACLGFAMPAYAEPIQITDSVTVGVAVNVDNAANCDMASGSCNGIVLACVDGVCVIE